MKWNPNFNRDKPSHSLLFCSYVKSDSLNPLIKQSKLSPTSKSSKLYPWEISTSTHMQYQDGKHRQKYNLRMVTNSSFHWPTSIVMLNSKSHIGNENAIIFWNSALNLQDQRHIKPQKPKGKRLKIYVKERNKDGYFDFSKGDQKAFLKLLIQPKNASCMPKIAVGGCKSIHGCFKSVKQ